jgi:hypothetical protein
MNSRNNRLRVCGMTQFTSTSEHELWWMACSLLLKCHMSCVSLFDNFAIQQMFLNAQMQRAEWHSGCYHIMEVAGTWLSWWWAKGVLLIRKCDMLLIFLTILSPPKRIFRVETTTMARTEESNEFLDLFCFTILLIHTGIECAEGHTQK